MNKKALSEREICTKFITPAIEAAGWDVQTQVREEVGFTKGRVIVRGKMITRGKPCRADYILYDKPNLPLAVIEAKDNNHVVDAGMQQALGYAEALDVPFVFSPNGDSFLTHIRTGASLRSAPGSARRRGSPPATGPSPHCSGCCSTHPLPTCGRDPR